MPTSLEGLCRDLRRGSRSRRRAAAEALLRLGDEAAVVALADALNDPERDVRRTATAAVAQAGPIAVPPLLEVLNTGHDAARRAAAEALGLLRDTRAVAGLIAILDEGRGDVRAAAVQALARLGRPAVDPLVRALGNRDHHARRGAAQALRMLGEDPLVAAVQDALVGRSEALMELSDPRAIVPLVEALQLANPNTRRAAADALGRVGDARAGDPLAGALLDPHVDVRRASARSLALVGDARAVDPLIEALGDPDAEVRQAAVHALARLGEHDLAAAVQAAMEGRLAALAQLQDPRLIRPLVRLLSHPDPDVRCRVARLLGGVVAGTVVEALARSLADASPRVRGIAAESLGRIGDPGAVPHLVERLDDGDRDVCVAVVKALGNLGSGAALSPLRALLEVEQDAGVWSVCRQAIRQVEAALRSAPAELEAASAPGGRGTELAMGAAPGEEGSP